MFSKQDIQTFRETQRILLRTEDYVYLLPHPALHGQISNYTLTFPNREIISEHYTVLPHGSATLVFSHDRDGWCGHLFGPMTEPCMVGGLANQFDMLLIVEFQPAGLSAFTGIAQVALANRTIPLESVNAALHRQMAETLERARHLEELIGRLDGLLLHHLNAAYPAALQIATELVLDTAGNLSGRELSASVYYSQRHLSRIFDQYLGMSPKTFSRLVRINKAIRVIQKTPCTITSASFDAGFFDLPHFIHDFKSVCGMTPQEYRDNMSDFYSEIAKY